jgi:hypothetical protein
MLDFSRATIRRDWIRRISGPLTEAAWEEMAYTLFSWQYARVPAYRRLCQGHEVHPRRLRSWREIPAATQQLFKMRRIFAHGSRRPGAIYKTSGTTTGQPGRQFLLHDDIYRSVAVLGAKRAGFLDGRPLHFLTPSPAKVPGSSLSAMFGYWARKSRGKFWVKGDAFDFAGLRKALLARKGKIGLAGTAFAFVHLLEAWEGLPPLHLPAGSWLLETGGFKGRSREVPKDELYRRLSRMFSIPPGAIWNEYGMSELSSQAYACGVTGLHATPPWARVLVCDPATGREVGVGRRGLVRWIDLANVDSVMALQTLDAAQRRADGFQLLGRLARTEPRGCSLSADDLAQAGAKP